MLIVHVDQHRKQLVCMLLCDIVRYRICFLALSLSLSLNLNVVICLNAVNFIAHLKSILQMVCMKRQSHNYILSHILVRFDKHSLQSKMVYTIE